VVERRQACALRKSARRIARCGGATLRLPAFRFLQFCRVVLSEAKPTRLGREEKYSVGTALRAFAHPTNDETGVSEDESQAPPLTFVKPNRFRD